MSNTANLLNFIADILLPLGLPINKVNDAIPGEGTERIVLNAIPGGNVIRWGTNRMNNHLVNINAYVPKLTDGRANSARMGYVEGLIISAIESYNSSTTRVKYYSLDCGTGSFFNESAKESLVNIRVKTSIT